jgi:hypothetical protein
MAKFTKIPSITLPKTNVKLTSLPRFKITTPVLHTPKVPSLKMPKALNLGSFTKAPKLPKAAKLATIKKAIKKVKNVGF